MEALRSAAAGEWLEPFIDTQWRDMHAVVPRGFPAYARIFHPVDRDRPAESKSWHRYELRAQVDVEGEKVTWSDVAHAFGKQMHALAQFGRLVGPVTPQLGSLDDDGWRYSGPDLGNLDPGILAKVAGRLCAHTSTPEDGVTAIWEGYGGLTSSAGYRELQLTDDGVWLTSDDASNPQSTEPGSGLLPVDVVTGGTLDLPGRSYFLFDTPPQLFLDTGWTAAAPWHHSPSWPQSPNLLWPADRSWVVVSEIDFDSTIVAGSRELIAALAQEPGIEAMVLQEGADLTWDADAINRPAG